MSVMGAARNRGRGKTMTNFPRGDIESYTFVKVGKACALYLMTYVNLRFKHGECEASFTSNPESLRAISVFLPYSNGYLET
jgi:hypothetical protein